MAYIKQRHSRDCGIATLAMLCGVTYDEANRVIPWRRDGHLYGTSTKMLVVGATKLGYQTRGTETGRLKIVKRPVDSASWFEIPDNSLVKIPHPDSPDHGWHWVAWRKNRVYDPARGVFHPNLHGGLPSSYLEFYENSS